eukprot:m.18749 g.18749  ORF g.18749 m.18749 type:complete len:124 (-) comp8356_c0_seq1:891-1262(-)
MAELRLSPQHPQYFGRVAEPILIDLPLVTEEALPFLSLRCLLIVCSRNESSGAERSLSNGYAVLFKPLTSLCISYDEEESCFVKVDDPFTCLLLRLVLLMLFCADVGGRGPRALGVEGLHNKT